MVGINIIAKVLLIILLLILVFFIGFIAQFYAPLMLWILSPLAVGSTLFLPYIINRRRVRIFMVSIFSLIICGNYIFYSIVGGSLIGFVYGLGLLMIIWFSLFLITETVSSLADRRLPER